MTAECLGVCISTVNKYKAGSTELAVEPPKRRRTSYVTDIKDNMAKEIRHVIYDMYSKSKF